MHTHGRIVRYTKYRLWTRKIKMIGQKKTGRNAPCKWFKLPREQDPLTESTRVSIHIYSTLFFLLRNTSLVSLLFLFVGIFLCKAEKPVPCHWPNIWCSPHHHLINLWPGTETLLQAAAGWGQQRSVHMDPWTFLCRILVHSFPQSAPRCSVSSWEHHYSRQWCSPPHPAPGGSRSWKTWTLSLVSLPGWAKWWNTWAVKFLQKEWIQIFMLQFFLE